MTRPDPERPPLPAPLRPGFPGIARLGLFAAVTAAYTTKIILEDLLYPRCRWRALRSRRLWARTTLRILGVDVDIQSHVPRDGDAELVLSNHRSYIDIAVVLGQVLASVVAKKEISGWPLLGTACRATRTIFVDRNSRDSRREVRDQIATLATDGVPVLIFPEGTTYEGPGALPLRTGTFSMASNGGFGVMPVALEYGHRSDAWIGADEFPRHFVECFSKRRTRVAVRFGPVMKGDDWQALLARCQAWLDENLREMREQFDRQRRVRP